MPQEWEVHIQQPITLSKSEPEPDLAITIGPEERYDAIHPGSKDVAIVIEVSDDSLAEDRRDKRWIYAQARIGIYWIVNLVDRQIEVYTLPRAGRLPTYRNRTDFQPGETVPVVLGGEEIGVIAVDEILP